MNLKMNYSDDFNFKNYFSSRNRSLTKDQKSILDFYQEKVSLESFSELDQFNDYKNISLEIGFGVGDILLHNALNFPNKSIPKPSDLSQHTNSVPFWSTNTLLSVKTPSKSNMMRRISFQEGNLSLFKSKLLFY